VIAVAIAASAAPAHAQLAPGEAEVAGCDPIDPAVCMQPFMSVGSMGLPATFRGITNRTRTLALRLNSACAASSSAETAPSRRM
jgi:hypothetical protein